MNLENKVVLVTGSSSGIGAATAVKFAEKGAKVVVNCKNNTKGAENTVKKCQSKGAESFYVQADVSNKKDVERMFAEIVEKFDSIDILINNAGAIDKASFLEADTEEWINVFNNNIIGTMLCSQFAAKIMMEKGSGKILNTSSIRGMENYGRGGIAAFSAAKGAVINFTKTLAKELAPTINVNGLNPGFVWVERYNKMDKALTDSFVESSLLKRWITVDEVADAFVYLATADAITGEMLTIDAGCTLNG